MVPSGASTGIHEALELRDKKKAFGGKGVLKAVSHINIFLAHDLPKRFFSGQKHFDSYLIKLDGTPNKRKLGENAILALSLAFARAIANKSKRPLYAQLAKEFGTKKPVLPIPFSNVLNGGVHAGNALEFQEFMIVPTKAKSFSDATQIVSETYHELKTIIRKKYGKNAINVGDEGGFAPPVDTPKEALDLLMKGMEASGHANKLKIAMDAAASEFYNAKRKTYLKDKLKPEQLMRLYEKFFKNYPVISLEDPFDQDDFQSWSQFTAANKKVQIVGDDLTVTNPKRVQLAIDQNLCNALLLKVNQVGSLSESLASAYLALKAKWRVMVSHRSGETEDSFIADLATGMGTGQIKLGAPARSDRVAKYNQLLRIEEELGRKAKYAKW